MPQFSVICPTYGRPEFLAEAIDSVLRQTVEDFELIVVDDASENEVTVPSDPRIRVIRRRANGGPAAARNTGLAAAQGTNLAFLDDDDLYEPHRLALAQQGLRDAAMAICHRRDTTGSTGGNRKLSGNVYDTILDRMTPHLGQIAVRRELAPSFDESLRGVEDVDWCLRAARSCPVTTIGKTGYVYRIHSGVRSGHGLQARIEGSVRLLDKHERYFSSHRRAAGFRCLRVALMARQLGDGELASAMLWRSLRLRPHHKTIWRLIAGRVDQKVAHPGRPQTKEHA